MSSSTAVTSSSSSSSSSLLTSYSSSISLLLAGLTGGFIIAKYCNKKKQIHNTAGSNPNTNPYETKSSLWEYLLMHYGEESDYILYPSLQDSPKYSIEFPKQCAAICSQYAKLIKVEKGTKLRALDLGCAVGRASFELCNAFDEVVGIDYSHSFVDACNQLKKSGVMDYEIRTEGDLRTAAIAKVDPKLDRSRVRFEQGDACALSVSRLGQYHVLLGANLIDRLPSPRTFLQSCAALIHHGGYLILLSPYTWLEQYTPKEEWLGGYNDAASGRPVHTLDTLSTLLASTFHLVQTSDVSFFIRETARKNQWSISQLSVWQRK